MLETIPVRDSAQRRLPSPFAPALRRHAESLPRVFRDQFLLPAEAPYHSVLEGVLDRVWHRPRWVWPILWTLAQGNVIFPDVGEHIRVSMTIRTQRAAGGQPYQHWRRTFHFPRLRFFNALATYDARIGKVVEWIYPTRRLGLPWELELQGPRKLVITSSRCFLRLGRRRLWLPRWLSPQVRAVLRADTEDDSLLHINVAIAHLLRTPIFGYHGTFHVRRSDQPADYHNHPANPTGGHRLPAEGRPSVRKGVAVGVA